MNQIDTIPMTDENVIIKAKYVVYGESIARKLVVSKDIKLEELEYKLRERFNVNYDRGVEIYYIDDDNDHIIITFEDELALALESSKLPVFGLTIKPKNFDKVCTYPRLVKGKIGELIEVLIESRWLTTSNATREDTIAWGTDIFTDDSDILKAVTHSEKVDLTDIPPRHDLIVTIRFLPGCLKYSGSARQGINTLSYGPHESSYIIEEVRIIPISNEKSEHHRYYDQHYDTASY
ncbi:6478_t:CDS:2 [Dentiscutata erythropus]|uniref:6478_t:CDS:1 n=1 Tax=Dentiscutata erythropus TaxID=1348616 RepID=A0A9N9EA06_9GLOM|nr:6478_t:CDS:2 [Dentiscutata erythropus]